MMTEGQRVKGKGKWGGGMGGGGGQKKGKEERKRHVECLPLWLQSQYGACFWDAGEL